MNFWSLINEKWSRQQIESWGSVRKTLYLLLPLFIYYLVHDVAEILLWAGLEKMMRAGSFRFTEMLNAHAFTVRGMVSGLSVLIAISVLYQAAKAEIVLPGKPAEKAEKAKVPITEKQLTAYIALAVTAAASSLCLNVLLNLTGLVKNSAAFSEAAAVQYGADFWAGILLYGIISPFAEEVIFRGLIFNRMKRCFNLPVALVISSLLFGCYHWNLVQGIYGFLMGMLIAFAYERYQSFAAPLLFHAVSNIGIYALTYFGGLRKRETAVSVLELLITAVIAAIGIYRMWAEGKGEESNERT